MTARRLLAALALVVPRLAAAEPHKLLVLQSEGRADAGLRAKIDAAILRLASAGDSQASAGELTFRDAATAVGCQPAAPGCKDEVLGMLAVDEIVLTTVTPKPGGVEIAVRRIARGGAAREATMLLAAGASPAQLDGIAPLFSDHADAPAAPAAPGAAPSPQPAPPPSPQPAPAIAPPAPGATGDTPAVLSPPATVAPAPAPVPATSPPAERGPLAHDPPRTGHRTLELAGMAGGGGMVVLGLVLWGAASGVQSDIDQAPTRTRQDLAHLKDLESRGDTFAALGNVLTISGAIVGGLAAYFYIKDRRSAAATSARLAPAVLDHGAGLVLTIGGLP